MLSIPWSYPCAKRRDRQQGGKIKQIVEEGSQRKERHGAKDVADKVILEEICLKSDLVSNNQNQENSGKG